jgi:hypothetical protein
VHYCHLGGGIDLVQIIRNTIIGNVIYKNGSFMVLIYGDHHGLFHVAHKNIPIELIGGLLDYCIYLEDDNCNHKIEILCCKTDIYSGYLWKCLVPKKWINDRANVHLDNVYFIWEHTDFTKSDALKYNLDSLYQKEKYIENLHGELLLLQKSSNHIQGTPIWEDRKFYDLLRGKTNEII